MTWQDILKRVEIVPESSMEGRPNFITAEEKGYPLSINPLKLVAEFDDDTDELMGYSSFKDFGKFYFVGNNYTFPSHTGKGINSKLMRIRNKNIDTTKPRIGLLQPFDKKSESYVLNKLKQGGAIEIISFDQVDDIMDKSMYEDMSKLRMFRYPPHKKETTGEIK